MTIGTNIKKLRTAAGLTQDQLAERLYVTRQTVSNWERGISRPDLDQLEVIAGALGANVTTLLYGDRPPMALPSKWRVFVTVLLLGLAALLWLVGARLLWPWVRAYVNSHYVYSYAIMFRGGYQAGASMLLSAGVLSLMGLRWDLSLGKRGRTAAGAVSGLLLGETLFVTLVGWCFERMTEHDGALNWAGSIAFQLSLKEICIPLGLVCGALLYMAFNPPRKAA